VTKKSFGKRMRARLSGSAAAWRPQSRREDVPPASSGPDRPYELQRVDLPAELLGKDERGTIFSDIAEAWLRDGGLVVDHMPRFSSSITTTLLFFDRIDIPISPVLIYRSRVREYLESLGVLSSSTVVGSGRDVVAITRSPFEALVARNNREPGRWTFARSNKAVGLPRNELDPAGGFAIELQEALPIFDRDVPLEETLEFKQRRFSELLALRHYMDELRLEVETGGLSDLASSVALTKFNSALADHVKVMNQSNRAKAWASLRASFSPDAGVSPMVELLAGHGAIALATGVGTIAIKTAMGLRRKRNAANPFEFLTSANQELY